MKKIITLSLVLSVCISLAQIPTNGLVAKYSFNGSGNITTDDHNGTYPLSNPLNVINTSGIHGAGDSAAYFSGGNFLEVNNAAFRTGSMSVSTWFKISSAQAYSTIAVIRFNTATSPYNSWNLYTGSNVGNKLTFTIKTSGSAETTLSGPTTLSNGVWYHATATYDAATGFARLYLNGMAEASSPMLSGPVQYNTSNNPMVIGNVVGTVNNGFVGSIDEFLYYNRALSVQEVENIMTQQNLSPNIAEPISPLRNFEEARVTFNGYGRDHAFKRVSAGQAIMGTGSTVAYTTDRFNNPIGALASSNVSYVFSPSATAHAGMDTAITVLGWVNRTASGQYGLFVNKRYSNSVAPFNSYGLGCGSGYAGYSNKLMGTISTSDTSDIMIGDNTVITDGTWYFVAMTYSAGEQKLKFYVNNNLVETKTVSGTLMQNNATPLYVGRGYPSSLHNFDGAVDDIRIFSKALSSAEMDSIRNLMPNTAAGIVSYYPLGYYPHDAVSGFDLGFNGNQAPDRFGTNGHATSFDGTNYIVPDYSPLHKPDTAITLEGWIYRTSEQMYSTMAGIRLNQSVAPFNSVLLAAGSGSGGKLLGVISTVNNPDVNIMSPNALPLNSWIHVGITYSAAQSKIKLYINGSKVNEVTASGNINYGNSTYKLSIGNASATPLANHYFIGSIDEVKLYNYAKTEAEFSSDLCIIAEPSITNSLNACAYSPVINLVGSPVGGNFSGPGINGNTFDPA
ncbi:MAG TPA: LamG domain-containing protein, partial [Bacteroidia bacterium]